MEKIIHQTNHYMMATYGRLPIVLDYGKGCYLYDQEGEKYLDFCSGIATNALGYGHQQLTEALTNQVQKLMHTSNFFYTEPQLKAAKYLVENTHFNRVFFCNSGTEANEAAIKLARKWGRRHTPRKYKIISMKNSFHGRTYGALAATGQPKYQDQFAPLGEGFETVALNHIEELEAALDEQVCAVLLEVIQGEGGVKPATKKYLTEVEKLCKEHDVLMIIDEVQTGIGRCGTLFAYMDFGIQPDVVTAAKGLGGGVPVGALLCTQQVACLEKGDHGTTFGGNPLATQAASTVLEILLEQGLLAHVKEVGSYLSMKLKELEKEMACIQEIRGKGLLQGIVLDKPIGPVLERCLKEKLIVIGAGEHVIRLLPPLIITKEQIDEGIARIKKCL